jgi:hypothetical protein
VGQRWKRRKIKIIKNTNEQRLILEITRTGNPGVTGNRVLLGLKKVPSMRKVKADHPLTVKAVKSKIHPKIQT